VVAVGVAQTLHALVVARIADRGTAVAAGPIRQERRAGPVRRVAHIARRRARGGRVAALPARTRISAVGEVPVVARSGVVVVLAPRRRVAGVGRAHVVVVAGERRPRVAGIGHAGLRPVAGVVVVALAVAQALHAPVVARIADLAMAVAVRE